MAKVKWLAGGFIIFLVLIILIANLGLGPVYFPFINKMPDLVQSGNFILMGLLSCLVNTLLHGKKVKVLSLNTLKGSLVVFTIVALEKLSQIPLVYRSFSTLDLTFDPAGIIIFGRLAEYIILVKHKGRNPV